MKLANVNRFPWLVVVLAGILVHGISLHNPFYFDDFYVIRENAWVQDLKAPCAWFCSWYVDSSQLFPGFRPGLMLSFLINKIVLGDAPESFRAINISLHLLNSCLVALFLQGFVPTKSKWIPWGAGLLFLLHPLQTLPINFIWKRSSLLEATLILTQLVVHVRERGRSLYRGRIILFQVFAFAAALMVKESALLSPILFLWADVCLVPIRKLLADRKTVILYASLLIAAGAFYWFRFDFIDQQIAIRRHLIPNWHSLSRMDYFLLSLENLPKYVGLWLVPDPRILDDPRPLSEFPWAGLIQTTLLFITSILICIRFNKEKLIWFSLGLFWICIGATMGVIPLFLPMDQVRLYLPLAGLSYVMVRGLEGLCSVFRSVRFEIVLGCLCVVYGVHSFLQNVRYAYPMLIWQDVVHEYEESDLGWGELGGALADAKLFPASAIAFTMAARVEPRRPGYSIMAYHTMLRAGVPQALIRPWLLGTMIRDMAIPDAVNLAVLLRELGEIESARELLRDLISRVQTYAPTYLQLASVEEQLGNNQEAQHLYEKTLQLAPMNRLAFEGLERLKKKHQVNH